MAEQDKQRYADDLVKIQEMKIARRSEKPKIDRCVEDDMPKRPLSAYMIFAKDVRKILKKKMPHCTLSDVMKAVSMDWVKLNKVKKVEYYGEARRRKLQYHTEYQQWLLQNGGPRKPCQK